MLNTRVRCENKHLRNFGQGGPKLNKKKREKV